MHQNTLKQNIIPMISFWMKNIPVHFMSFSFTDKIATEITIVTKAYIYDCLPINQQHFQFNINWQPNEGFAQQILNYLTSINQYGMIVINKEKSSTNSIEEEYMEKVLSNYQQSYVCCDEITLFYYLSQIHNIQLKKEEMNEKLLNYELINQIPPCQAHQANSKQCTIYKCYKFATIIQTVMKEKGIELIHIEQLLPMESKQKQVEIKPISTQQKQPKQQNIQEIPYNNITILYLEQRTESENIIEIGFTFFKQNNKENNGQYIMIEGKEPQIFQIKPEKPRKQVEYFNDKYSMNDCIVWIVQNVIQKEKFDIIVYKDKFPMKLLYEQDKTIETTFKIVKETTFLKKLWTRNQNIPNVTIDTELKKMDVGKFLKSLNVVVCPYHQMKGKDANGCLLKSPYLFEKKMNHLYTYHCCYGKTLENPIPSKQTNTISPIVSTIIPVIPVFQPTVNESPLKEWIPTVPVVFMKMKGWKKEMEFDVVVKSNIYDCHLIENTPLSIPKNNNNKLAEYLKQYSSRVIIILNTSSEKCDQKVITMLDSLKQSFERIIITPVQLMKCIMSQFNKPFNEGKFNQLINSFLSKQWYIKNDYQQPSIPFLTNHFIQTQMKKQNIPLQNENELPLLISGEEVNQLSKNIPFNKTFLFISDVIESDQIIEIGCVFVKHDESFGTTNQYRIVYQPQSFYCKPKQETQGLEYFSNCSPIEEVIKHIYNAIICQYQFDMIVYQNKSVKQLFNSYDTSKWQKCNFSFLTQLIIENKLNIKVKSIVTQRKYVYEIIRNDNCSPCEFHVQNKDNCILVRLESDISYLNYFNDYAYQIHAIHPF